MAWSLVAHTKNGNADGAVGPYKAPNSGSVNTTGADLYLVGISFYSSSDPGAGVLTDVSGNTYSILPGQTAAGDATCRVLWFYKAAPATSTVEVWTITVDGSSRPGNCGMCCLALSGAAASPTITHTESGTTSSTPSAGSLGANGNLIATAVSDYSATVSSVDSSFAISDLSNYTAGNNIGIATAWKGVSGAANPTFTLSAAPTASAVQAISVTGAAASGPTVAQEIPAFVQEASGQMVGMTYVKSQRPRGTLSKGAVESLSGVRSFLDRSRGLVPALPNDCDRDHRISTRRHDVRL